MILRSRLHVQLSTLTASAVFFVTVRCLLDDSARDPHAETHLLLCYFVLDIIPVIHSDAPLHGLCQTTRQEPDSWATRPGACLVYDHVNLDSSSVLFACKQHSRMQQVTVFLP